MMTCDDDDDDASSIDDDDGWGKSYVIALAIPRPYRWLSK